MLWTEEGELRLQVFRGDIEDHRDFEYGYVGYTRSRLQVGSFYFPLKGDPNACNLRLDLYRATLVGKIGDYEIKLFVHTHDPIISCEVKGADASAWRWAPAKAEPTRPDPPTTEELVDAYMENYRVSRRIKRWTPNPSASITRSGPVTTSVQDLLGGGQHAVAWKTEDERLLISVCKSFPKNSVWHKAELGAAETQARNWLEKEFTEDWERSHLEWWANYYPKSFVSLPDEQVETVYWTQVYKMASATRGHYPMADTAGIWQTPSAWPYITWNLNVQLTYLPYYVSNRFELAESLIHSLWTCRENLRKNIRPVEWQEGAYWVGLATGSDLDNPWDMDQRDLHKGSCGNLIWALHCVWLHGRHSMDAELMNERLVPLLRGAVTYVCHLLQEEDDGLLHLMETFSPEFGATTDATYDLALLKWGLKTLLELAPTDDAKRPYWKDVLDRLPGYAVDKNGFRIGRDASFDRAHRHSSHLLQVYPLFEVTREQPESRAQIERSIQHFYTINQAEYDRTGHWDGFSAYTWTALASLSAAIGNGDDALRYLRGFISYDRVHANSLYGEWGPCLESPLSAAQCVHDMLLQSWGGIIRPFPAMPSEWTSAVFHRLSAEGGFDVSSEWKRSKLHWLVIASRAGSTCKVLASNFEGMTFTVDGKNEPFPRTDNGLLVFNLQKGQTAQFCPPSVQPSIEPLPSRGDRRNWYGLH